MININKLYNENCINIAGSLKENSVDLIIADPFFDEWDKYYDFPLHMLKEDGVFVAFSNRPHTGRLQVELDKRMKLVTEIVWNFSDGRWVSNKLPRICHENILIYTKSKKNPLNDMRLLEWIEKPKQVKKGGANIGRWTSGNNDRIYTPQELSQVESVIYQPRNVGKYMGVISKPPELIKLLLKMCSEEGDTVFDPFSGSGIIPKLAIEMERKYIACEIDEEKYKTILLNIN